MPMIDGRQFALDSTVHQHKCEVGRSSAADGDDVVDSVPPSAEIDYEGVGVAGRFSGFELIYPPDAVHRWLAAPESRQSINAKAAPYGATGVSQCFESFRRLFGNTVKQPGGARNAVAHNMGGPTTRPAVSFLEGPAANVG